MLTPSRNSASHSYIFQHVKNILGLKGEIIRSSAWKTLNGRSPDPMNTRRNTAAEEFSTDCMAYMTGFTLLFVSILSVSLILWA